MRSNHTRILVTGGEGQLASALSLYFPYADYPGKKELDVSKRESCDHFFWGKSYDLIIHTAAEIAYNAPRETLESVNVGGTANITRWAQQLHARMVYLSTDYSYGGQRGSYVETDACSPIGDYGRSKYSGECAALSYHNCLAIRTSFYSQLHLQSAATDAFTSKIPIGEAAGLIAGLCTSSATGIINVGGPRRSIYEIAVQFNPRVRPISRSEVHLPYELPRDVSLNCSRMKSILGLP